MSPAASSITLAIPAAASWSGAPGRAPRWIMPMIGLSAPNVSFSMLNAAPQIMLAWDGLILSPSWPGRGPARRERESCSRPRQGPPGGDVEEVDLTPIIMEAYPLAGCGREAAWAAYHDFGIARLAERGHQDDLGPQHLGRDRM